MDTHCQAPIDSGLVEAFASYADAEVGAVDGRVATMRGVQPGSTRGATRGESPTDDTRRTPSRHELGRLGERIAAHHLRVGHGCSVLAANWRIADEQLRGELDLVVIDPRDSAIVVCEVKTRRDATRFGGAIAALGPRQQLKIRRLAARFLAMAELGARPVRFDVVAVDLGSRASLTHVADAW